MPAADRWLPRIAACALLTGLAVSGCAHPAAPAAGPAQHQAGPRGPRRRWVFDILLSSPGAARRYRLPFARYAAATGCTAR